MKRNFRQILSVLLVAVMLIGCAPIGGLFTVASAASKKITEYSVGDIVEFGSYPQSEVIDELTASALESKAPNWDSWTFYGYMSGVEMNYDDGSASESDYMRYCDVEYDGAWYRGVRFVTYRPYHTNYHSNMTTSYTYQNDNGYIINTTYWFKYEMLRWRVLDPAAGLVLCENVIDSQPYSKTLYYSDYDYYNAANIYANSYHDSSLREWINNDFYKTAFTDKEKSQINGTIIRENKAYSEKYSKYDNEPVMDPIFLLDYQDAANTAYGFSADLSSNDVNRRAHSTDYAKCQGCDTYTAYMTADGEDTSEWWLRSAGETGEIACYIWCYGDTGEYGIVNYTHMGVRPALNFNTSSALSSSLHGNADWKDIPEYTVPDALTAHYNDPLFSVRFPSEENGVWEWDREVYDSDTDVGDVGVKYFKANFVPHDTKKYETVYGISVPVTVLQAKPVFEIPKDLTATLGQTLADVKLPDTADGRFAWNVKSPEAVKLVKVGTVTQTAIYIPNDSNYMTVTAIELSITVICTHSKVNFELTEDATCTEYGRIIKICADCGETVGSDTVPPKGHRHGAWEITVPPTTSAEGQQICKCTECGIVLETRTIEKIKATVKSVALADIELKCKSLAKLPTAITADSGAKYTVRYSSNNTKVATVDDNGNVLAVKKGSAKITCTVTDEFGNTVSDSCNVNVKYTAAQWLIVILLFGWIWY